MKRAVLSFVFALLAAAGANASEPEEPNVVPLDWGLATTLLGMGVDVPAIAEKPAFLDWVQDPAPPPSAPDLGLRLAPDMERLQAAEPDLILVSPQFASIRKRLESVAPVHSFATFTPDKTPLANARRITRELGDLLRKPEAAEKLIADTERAIATLRAKSAEQPNRCAFLVVNFVDAGHARVFGEGSLYGGVLEGAGLSNAWTGATNFWGFTTVPLAALLHQADAELIVVAPVPVEVNRMLDAEQGGASESLLGKIPSVRDGRFRVLRPIWSFGGLTEATTFAKTLSATALPSCSNDNS
ncbi:ABC transporter substrate-binding protein [uncultured Nitratireductor sp.]|uniref:ABC transporter substrate-binding protein n=1 Tax=uncultured Nitratireductor sp. TaxID=520953 RepID=UPI0025EFAF20|nr:ABC transporter substrate-binding protein [uncultured Nitratireductor sp.]